MVTRTEKVERLTYSIPEVARVLGVSEGTTYSMVHDGRLPAIRISSKRLVVARVEIERLLGIAGTG